MVQVTLEPKHMTIRARMPDGSYWDVNGDDLMKRKSAMTFQETRNILGSLLEGDGSRLFAEIDAKLIAQFVSGPEKALLDWASSIEWAQLKDIAKKLNSEEPDHTLGWRLGTKEIFKK